MAQYIDKDCILAEIERIKKSIGSDRFLSEFEHGCNLGKEDVCDDLHNFLDTLEVKEVDLEEIIEQTYFDNSVTDNADIDHVTYENIAKHFYELGLKVAQKGE